MTTKTPSTSTENTKDTTNTKRGFAAMPSEQVKEIASKGGHASTEKAGHEGMSERGQHGGQARTQQAGHEGMAEMGRKGGSSTQNNKK